MGMPVRRLIALFVLAVGVVLAPAGAALDPKNPPQGVFDDSWYLMMFSGEPVGYMHSTTTREDGEIVSAVQMKLTLRRGEIEIGIDLHSTSRETLAGRPLAFENRLLMAKQEMSVRGTIEGRTVRTVTNQFGLTNEAEFELPEGAVMSWGSYLAMHEKGLKPGTKYSLEVYSPVDNPAGTVQTTIEIGQREKFELLGKQVEGIRTNQSVEVAGMKLDTVAWVDDEGTPLRSDTSLMGMNVQVLLTDKETALARAAGGKAEFFISTFIRPDRPIDAGAARSVTFRLSLTDGAKLTPPPETGMQTARANADGSVTLTVKRQDHAGLAARKGSAGSPAGVPPEFMAASPMINWKDPEIAKMAVEALGDADGPYAVAVRLREYTTRVIEDKNLGVGFASASEVARNREGDCSEHGVFLAALGRACGIPSRVAAGLVYVPEFAGQKNVFGFHMWTQMHIDGVWVDLDAAQRETDCNPTHIALQVAALDDGGFMDLVAPMFEVIGKLKIEVEKVETE